MMQHFLSRLKTDYGYLNFYFNRIYTDEGVRYHISVMDRSNKAQIFQMEAQDTSWKILDPETCPLWIAVMEKQLEDEIFLHLLKK